MMANFSFQRTPSAPLNSGVRPFKIIIFQESSMSDTDPRLAQALQAIGEAAARNSANETLLFYLLAKSPDLAKTIDDLKKLTVGVSDNALFYPIPDSHIALTQSILEQKIQALENALAKREAR
jgi:hypothetical protein